MERNELAKIIDDVFLPNGFKRKGNYWLDNSGEIVKMINLQKSEFGNFFYINWGYILKSIPLKNVMMHIYNRLTSLDVNEREKINRLLKLENEIPDQERAVQLKEILTNKLLVDIQSVNSESDLLEHLKSLSSLNTIPLTVRKHFHLELPSPF